MKKSRITKWYDDIVLLLFVLGLALVSWYFSSMAYASGIGVSGSGVGGLPARLNVANMNVTSTTSENILTLKNISAFGSCMRMTGNGASTPSKTLCAFGGNLDIWNNAESYPIFRIKDDGTLVGLKPCATGFAREGPNYCHRVNLTAGITLESWVSATACTARSPATVTLPADAKSADIILTAAPISNALVSWKTNELDFYTTSACTAATVAEKYFFRFREGVADTAGNDLAYIPARFRVPLVVANTFYTTTVYGNINGSVNMVGYTVVGYWD